MTLSSNDASITIKNIFLTYPGSPSPAVDGLNLSIGKGEIFGLLGPNGAGKTTAISMMSTLIKPSSGTITIEGKDAARFPKEVKKLIGYVPQEIALYAEMTARENLRYLGQVLGMKGIELEERISECIELVGLEGSADKRVHTYSGGMKRRANLAAGILNRPKILFLDEPTAGIDPQSRNLILDKLSSMRSQTTMVYTTHYLGEVEQICSRIAIMDAGRIIADGALEQLYSMAPGSATLEDVFIRLTGRRLRD
jgi:ABC-2 type transport system ATP-binding protein